ncbi:MAG: (2Fe-2S)-binding protein [Proteobacteria bacterium]|nr:(2Fe-2S)-binding protein [Pseudomonadota bacterium]
MSKVQIALEVNGDRYEVAVAPWRTLAELLRDELRLTGTKIGCETGDCGACTVLLDGVTVNSCLVLAVEAEGAQVTTVEGLSNGSDLDPLQEAFVKYGAVQCGYCTPGMLLSAKYLLGNNDRPTKEEIQKSLSGNLCRCTGYYKIIEAIDAVAREG